MISVGHSIVAVLDSKARGSEAISSWTTWAKIVKHFKVNSQHHETWWKTRKRQSHAGMRGCICKFTRDNHMHATSSLLTIYWQNGKYCCKKRPFVAFFGQSFTILSHLYSWSMSIVAKSANFGPPFHKENSVRSSYCTYNETEESLMFQLWKVFWFTSVSLKLYGMRWRLKKPEKWKS